MEPPFEFLQRIPPKLRWPLIVLAIAVVEGTVEILLPSTADGISKALRTVLEFIPTNVLIAFAAGAMLSYLLDERKRWTKIVRGWITPSRSPPDTTGDDIFFSPTVTQRAPRRALTERESALLIQIYRILQDEMLPAYDEWGDKIAGPWREIVKAEGTRAYIGRARGFPRKPAAAVEILRRLLEKNAIHYVVTDEFGGAPEIHNETLAAQSAFLAALQLLPDHPDEKNLKLVDREAQNFQSAVGAYGQWIRGRIKIAEEITRRAGAK